MYGHSPSASRFKWYLLGAAFLVSAANLGHGDVMPPQAVTFAGEIANHQTNPWHRAETRESDQIAQMIASRIARDEKSRP
jgi:hypothetical protein